MTEETQQPDKLNNLISQRNKVLDDLEKSRKLLAEIEAAIAGSNGGTHSRNASAGRQASNVNVTSASTGIPRLDDLLNGGFPYSANVLLSGPPYSSKFVVADSFIVSTLLSASPVVVVSLDRDIESIRSDLALSGINLDKYEEQGLLKFVDAYSRNIQMENSNKNAVMIDNAGNLSNFLKTMDTICSGIVAKFGKYSMVFFSLTAWITQASDDKNFTKAFQHFSQRRKLEGATTLFLIEDGIFQKSLYENMNYFMDGAIEFRSEASTEYLRIRGMRTVRSRDWIEIMNTSDGLSLGSFELKRIR